MTYISSMTDPASQAPGRDPLYLVPKTKTISESCVKSLENMLEMARDGRLSGVAIAGVDLEGFSHSAYSEGENISTLIGSLERLKYRLLKAGE